MHRQEEGVETKRQRIAEKAGREPRFQFTSLFHLMNEELLLGCYERLRNDAAAGIDEVTKAIMVTSSNFVTRVHLRSRVR